jgi:hypothetical protein
MVLINAQRTRDKKNKVSMQPGKTKQKVKYNEVLTDNTISRPHLNYQKYSNINYTAHNKFSSEYWLVV